MKHPLHHLFYATLLAALATPCTVWSQAKAAPPISGVIGKLQLFTGSSLNVMTSSGAVHIVVEQPLTTYKQIPSDLNHVTAASYVGAARHTIRVDLRIRCVALCRSNTATIRPELCGQ
jgi:hypothetical protein